MTGVMYSPCDRHILYDGARWIGKLREAADACEEANAVAGVPPLLNSVALLLYHCQATRLSWQALLTPFVLLSCSASFEDGQVRDAGLNIFRLMTKTRAAAIKIRCVRFLTQGPAAPGGDDMFVIRDILGLQECPDFRAALADILIRASFGEHDHTLLREVAIAAPGFLADGVPPLLIKEFLDRTGFGRGEPPAFQIRKNEQFVDRWVVTPLCGYIASSISAHDALERLIIGFDGLHKHNVLDHHFYQSLFAALALAEHRRPDLMSWLLRLSLELFDEDALLTARLRAMICEPAAECSGPDLYGRFRCEAVAAWSDILRMCLRLCAVPRANFDKIEQHMFTSIGNFFQSAATGAAT